MIRVRVPGGVCTLSSGLVLINSQINLVRFSKINYSAGISVVRRLKVQPQADHEEVNDTLLDTLAACGDVNRNVMSPANPFESELHGQALALLSKFMIILLRVHPPMQKSGSMVKKQVQLVREKWSRFMGRPTSLEIQNRCSFTSVTMSMYFPTASALLVFLKVIKWLGIMFL